MTTKPIYSFLGTLSIGLDKIPLNSIIMIKEVLGKAKIIQLIDNTNITDASTIADLLLLPNQYQELDTGIGEIIGESIAISYDGSALSEDSNGDGNIGLGKNSGRYLTTGYDNIFIGESSGRGDNTIKVTGHYNIMTGFLTGELLSSGFGNIGSGFGSAQFLTSGYYNTFIGSMSGKGNNTDFMTGNYNAALGYYSANAITSGSFNTLIGPDAGRNITSGDSNVFIGYYAGSSLTTESNQLRIASSQTKTLISGDFFDETVTINGELTLPTGYDLSVHDTINLGPNKEAGIVYNSSSDSIDFIIN